jgi:hypothetical protein
MFINHFTNSNTEKKPSVFYSSNNVAWLLCKYRKRKKQKTKFKRVGLLIQNKRKEYMVISLMEEIIKFI